MKLRTLRLTLIIGIILLSLTASGQEIDSAAYRQYYNEHALFWNGSSWNKYSQNGKLYSFKQMEDVVRFSPDATRSYHQFMKDRTASAILLGLSTGLIASSILVKSPELKGGLAIGGLTIACIAIPLSKRWTFQLNRTIWIYNREIMLQRN